jgi:4-carboxymuconolactone decarboxylase
VGGPYEAWLHRPELARRASRLGDYSRYDADVPRDLAEFAILIAGRHWDASYEFSAHAPIARADGLPEGVIKALRTGDRPVFADRRTETIYDLLTEYYATHRVSDATYRAATEELGEELLVDLVAIAGYYGLVCMTLNVFQVPLPEGVDDPFDAEGRPSPSSPR